jgi:hypothetical protein
VAAAVRRFTTFLSARMLEARYDTPAARGAQPFVTGSRLIVTGFLRRMAAEVR